MLCITLIFHFCFMQLQGDKKQNPNLYLQQAGNVFCVDPTAFMSVNKFIKNLPNAGKRLTTAKYVFFIGAAIQIAVSFSEF